MGVPGCPEGSTICCVLVAVAQVGGDSSALNLFVPSIRPMKIMGTVQAFSSFFQQDMRGFLGTFVPLLFPSVLQLLSPSMPLLTKY